MKQVAIIGGGIGGLITALLLSKRGMQVTLFEKEKKLGGRLTFVERNGFRIDEGPTIVLLPKMLISLLEEAGISSSQYELIACDPLYSMHFPDGTTFTKYPDKERQIAELKRVFPQEVDGFKRFLEDGERRFLIGQASFLEKDFVRAADFWNWSNMKKLWQLKPHQSVQKLVSNYFEDDRLQAVYALQSLYVGGNPYQVPAMYSLVSFSEHAHGVHYVKGGYASLVDVLLAELQKRNVELHLNTKIDHVVMKGQRAIGIQKNGVLYRYDAIVYNGEIPTLNEMLHQPQKRKYVPSSGCFLMYFGLNRTYNKMNIHQYFMGESFKEHMKDVFERKQLPTDPAFYTFHPSVLDPTLAPAGKGVLYVLIPVPSDTTIPWKEQTEWIERIIDRMEQQGFDGLRQAIEWMEVRTPDDAQAFGLFQGGSFGIAPTLFQSGVFRPQIKVTPYENIYAVGASVHPGGGIPLVMQGASLLVEQLIKDQFGEGEKADEPISTSIPTL